MKKSYRLILGLLLSTCLMSCDQGATPDPLPEASNEKLAYAIAAALDNPDVRESVHEAMDASPYYEHKLVFDEFLNQPEGAVLKESVANKLGGEDVLNELLGELPSMDFYLPYETHRDTWEHARNNLFVACVLDPDAEEATFYHPDGSTENFNSRQEIEQAEIAAMFSLHPKEPKIRREASTGGEPKANRHGSGTVSKIQSGSWKMRVEKIENYTWDGYLGGACEFYFLSRRLDVSQATESKQVVVGSGKPSRPYTEDISPELWINPNAASESDPIKVRVKEADGGVNGDDDDYGYFEVSEEGKYRTSKNQGLTDKPKAYVWIDIL